MEQLYTEHFHIDVCNTAGMFDKWAGDHAGHRVQCDNANWSSERRRNSHYHSILIDPYYVCETHTILERLSSVKRTAALRSRCKM